MTQPPHSISVIGAGIMGITTAYILQSRFADTEITLYDQAGFPANNASYIAGGMLSPLSELDHMPAHFLNAAFHAIDIWQEISREEGDNFEFNRQGSLLLSHDNDRYILERFKSILPDKTKEKWRPIGQEDIASLEPNLKDSSFRNGISIKDEAHLHPQKAMETLLQKIINKDVQRIDLESKNDDHLIIDCRGITAQKHLTDLRGVKGETIVVHNPEFRLNRPVRIMHPRYPLYIVPREGNIFMVGATIIESNASENLSIRSAMELLSALYSLHPSFAEAEILETNAKNRPSFPDNMPHLIDESADNQIIRCNGLYRHGYLFAPVLAECVADLIAGKENPYTPLFLRSEHENHIERSVANA